MHQLVSFASFVFPSSGILCVPKYLFVADESKVQVVHNFNLNVDFWFLSCMIYLVFSMQFDLLSVLI